MNVKRPFYLLAAFVGRLAGPLFMITVSAACGFVIGVAVAMPPT